MEKFYEINYNEETLNTLKSFSKQTLQIMPDDTLKCPFQYNDKGTFQNCLFRQCMAYRCNGKVFWCARLEQRECDDKMLHSVEIL